MSDISYEELVEAREKMEIDEYEMEIDEYEDEIRALRFAMIALSITLLILTLLEWLALSSFKT